MNSESLIGSRLGKYQILAEIGQGGMGTVYKGYDPSLDRHVAIKVLAPYLAWEKAFVERFMREARAAARLQHPNIVTIHDVGQEAGWYYYVMEYLEGQTLTKLIQEQHSLRPEAALAILQPLADALDYAHQKGLVHRDIKPGNIMVGRAGRVFLTDFGIARAAQDTGLTATGATVGTPKYMSPEQIQGLGVDSRSDQYSLAVVAYEMLSGQAPFEADSTVALLYMVVHEPPPPIRQIRPDLPESVGRVLGRGLAKAPASRYPTVGAFVAALAGALSGKMVEAPPVGPVDAAGRRVPAWLWVLGLVAMAFLIAGGLLMRFGTGRGEATPVPSLTAVVTHPTAVELPATSTPQQKQTPADQSSPDTPVALSPTATIIPRIAASHTPTSTDTPKSTATPTDTPTHTPTPTDTPRPSPTATRQVPVPSSPAEPTFKYIAPSLLDPGDEQVFAWRDTITLVWQAVGELGDDEFYEIILTYLHDGQIWVDETPWTKIPRWTLSEHPYLLDLADREQFHWAVRVMRKTGIDDKGRPIGIALSPLSQERILIWKRKGGNEEPTLAPP